MHKCIEKYRIYVLEVKEKTNIMHIKYKILFCNFVNKSQNLILISVRRPPSKINDLDNPRRELANQQHLINFFTK